MKSKEEKIQELFFNYPTKEWHFEEIIKNVKIARSKADNWLKKFIKLNLIKRHKTKGKMPYYISNHQAPEYKNKKKIYALNKLYNSGLLNYLDSIKNTKTIILFGSFTRSDWYKNSDIDIFIYGDTKELNITKYELKLKREIQTFTCKNKKELNKLGSGLIKNIIKGNLIKGNLDFIGVGINA
jgi:predicted nucleotidyltransferase